MRRVSPDCGIGLKVTGLLVILEVEALGDLDGEEPYGNKKGQQT